MIVKFIADKNSMTPGKKYKVIGIEGDDYRIINDNNDPCLYEPKSFEVVDSSEPKFWISKYGESGERYAYPREWHEIGFFEDYHDGASLIISQFWRECKKYYGINREE